MSAKEQIYSDNFITTHNTIGYYKPSVRSLVGSLVGSVLAY